MTTHIYGNDDNLNVSVTTSNDTYIIGNGNSDTVTVSAVSGDTIVLGNGTSDTVVIAAFGFDVSFSNNYIALGNGNADSVSLTLGAGVFNASGDTFVFGTGNGDQFTTKFGSGLTDSTIKMGNGIGDVVTLDIATINNTGNTVTLGSGAGDSVSVNTSGNGITLGDGNADTVTDGSVGGNVIILGNGIGDQVILSKSPEAPDAINMGDGKGDTVTAPNFTFEDAWNIKLGNGANDSVGTNTANLAGNGAEVVVGGGNNDQVYLSGNDNTITLGNGNNDFVRCWTIFPSDGNNSITVGNGNGDTIDVSFSNTANVTVGNGNDTILAGKDNVVTLGNGSDLVTYDWTKAGSDGVAGTITGFNTSKDVIQLHGVSSVTIADNSSGNATISDGLGDTVTLIGVHAADLHVGATGNVQLV
jgi:hypothetical protein